MKRRVVGGWRLRESLLVGEQKRHEVCHGAEELLRLQQGWRVRRGALGGRGAG